MTYREALVALVEQLEKNDPSDEIGHKFKMNKSYVDAKAMLDRDKPAERPENDGAKTDIGKMIADSNAERLAPVHDLHRDKPAAPALVDRSSMSTPPESPMTQRQALNVLLLRIEGNGFTDDHAVKLAETVLFNSAKRILERDDELTLEEVRQLLIADNVRAGFAQAVVITADRFVLVPITAVDLAGGPGYTDLAVLPHNPDGTVPADGHPAMPNGEPPSMKNLRKFLEV